MRRVTSGLLLLVLASGSAGQAAGGKPMLRPLEGWSAVPVLTVGEKVGDYAPPGVLDGLGAYALDEGTVRVLVNHEIGPGDGHPYALANGTVLTGARVSRLDIDRATRAVRSAGVAYVRVFDRAGAEVVAPSQISETANRRAGLSRLCSATLVAAGTYGFADTIFFTCEESATPDHPHGGSVWALDVAQGDLRAAPALGRGSWENVAPVETGDPATVALLLGDDEQAAPLYLYVGRKRPKGGFLARNGLEEGVLLAWKSDDGARDPQGFHGDGEARDGAFVPLTVRDPARAGARGFDGSGYADDATLRAEADARGCFSFSRPEDLATNPASGTQAAFASCGRGKLYPADNWGTVYRVDVRFEPGGNARGLVTILHDADGLEVPDKGIRNPDNLAWGRDGWIYVQEDRATEPVGLFGAATGAEASVWAIDPVSRAFRRIAEIDRSAVAPPGAKDRNAGEIGHWESSGVIDVTGLFGAAAGETVLLLTVQAHGIRDGAIGGSGRLVEGGQLLLLSGAPAR